MRPTLLVAEPEPDNALSTRKLVLETSKFNVLTAHTDEEAMEIARNFPNMSGAIVAAQNNSKCEALAKRLRDLYPKMKIIGLTPGAGCSGADHILNSHDPEGLVKLMRKLFGDPRKLP